MTKLGDTMSVTMKLTNVVQIYCLMSLHCISAIFSSQNVLPVIQEKPPSPVGTNPH